MLTACCPGVPLPLTLFATIVGCPAMAGSFALEFNPLAFNPTWVYDDGTYAIGLTCIHLATDVWLLNVSCPPGVRYYNNALPTTVVCDPLHLGWGASGNPGPAGCCPDSTITATVTA